MNFIEPNINYQHYFSTIFQVWSTSVWSFKCKVECVVPVVVVSLLPHAEFGRNDHRVEAPHFISSVFFNFSNHLKLNSSRKQQNLYQNRYKLFIYAVIYFHGINLPSLVPQCRLFSFFLIDPFATGSAVRADLFIWDGLYCSL